MAERVITTKAVIEGQDKSGPAFKEAEAHAKALGATVAMVDQRLTTVGKATARIDKLTASFGKLRDIAASKEMIAGLSNFDERIASTQMIARMEAAGRAARATSEAIHLIGTNAVEAALQTSRITKAMDRVAAHARKVAKEMVPFAEGAAGIGILHATRMAVQSGADLQGELARMKVAGIPAREIEAASSQSAELARQNPNITRAQILQAYKETRSVLVNPEETPALMPTIAAAKSAMDALDTSGHLSEGLAYAVKGAEVLGITQNPERFKAYLDSFLKAQQVMGKTITPEQQYEFAKYVKASGISLSDRFKMTTAVSLAQEMGGSTTGQSIDQFVKQIIGGFQGNNHSAAKEFVRLGLANKDDFEKTRTGEIKGMKFGRKVKGSEVARADPDYWVYQYLQPAMEKAGITSLDDQIAEVRRLFPAGRAADAVSKMISQRPSFASHAKQYDSAAGIAGGKTLLTEKPTAALDALNQSLLSFGGTLTSPVMKDAAKTLSSWASTIGGWGNELTKWQKDNPELAKAGGKAVIGGGALLGSAGAYGFVASLMSGFGLKGSAIALDESAAALTAAAARLGGAPGLGLPPGGKSSNKLKGPGWRAWGYAGTLLGDIIGLPDINTEEGQKQIKANQDAIARFNRWAHEKAPWFFGSEDEPSPTKDQRLGFGAMIPEGGIRRFVSPSTPLPRPRPHFASDTPTPYGGANLSMHDVHWSGATQKVQLDPNSKAAVAVHVTVEVKDGEVVKALAKATSKIEASGSLKAGGPGSTGKTDFGNQH